MAEYFFLLNMRIERIVYHQLERNEAAVWSLLQKKNALWRIRFNMHWHRLQSRIMPPI